MTRLVVLSLLSALLAGCVVVPYGSYGYHRDGYYHRGYDSGYYGYGYRGYYRDHGG
ncbi:MAG TPA: hypothetical protein VF814_20370 [Casimicrobiaceae bacterium]